MTTSDIVILALMTAACIVAAGTFASMVRYLFDRNLADRNAATPNLIEFYKTYMIHTRKTTGRIPATFWVHCGSAAVFIATGVVFTIFRFILPRFW